MQKVTSQNFLPIFQAAILIFLSALFCTAVPLIAEAAVDENVCSILDENLRLNYFESIQEAIDWVEPVGDPEGPRTTIKLLTKVTIESPLVVEDRNIQIDQGSSYSVFPLIIDSPTEGLTVINGRFEQINTTYVPLPSGGGLGPIGGPVLPPLEAASTVTAKGAYAVKVINGVVRLNTITYDGTNGTALIVEGGKVNLVRNGPMINYPNSKLVGDLFHNGKTGTAVSTTGDDVVVFINSIVATDSVNRIQMDGRAVTREDGEFTSGSNYVYFHSPTAKDSYISLYSERPAISGDWNLVLGEGYKAGQSKRFTTLSAPVAQLAKVEGEESINWNSSKYCIEVDPGLKIGTYSASFELTSEYPYPEGTAPQKVFTLEVVDPSTLPAPVDTPESTESSGTASLKDLKASNFKADLRAATYSGQAQKVSVAPIEAGIGAVTVKYNGSKTAPVNAGNYAVTVDVAKGAAYKAVSNLPLGTYSINKASLSKVSAALTDVAWTGKQSKPVPAAFKFNGANYPLAGNAKIVRYGANKDIGKGTIQLEGSGNFTGAKTLEFKIIPKASKVSKVTAGKKSAKISWSKAPKAEQITGYQVRYRTAGKGAWKTTNIYPAKASSATIKGLKQGKKYEVQIRAYKKAGGAKYYSTWSKSKPSKKIK